MNVHLLLLTAVSFGCTTVTVQASTTGAFTVEGLIQNSTCDLAAGDVNRTVTLDPIPAAYFDKEQSSPRTYFDLTANCGTGIKNVTFAFSGEPAKEDTWRFANTGTAKGIALLLMSNIQGESTIRANGSDSVRTMPVVNGIALLPLAAAYWKLSAVGPGDLKSRVVVNITYN